MIDLTGVTHHKALEDIVDVLCNKTQNTDRGFFRTEVAYFLAKMASSMRATIVTKDRGEIPVNLYALALATSGFGKGHSVNIVETEFMKGFKNRYMQDTFPVLAEANLWKIANARAARNGTDAQLEFDAAEAEFRRAGAFPFTFDSGTPPAVKQLRHKLLLSDCGSINLQIDEIGSNLIGSTDVLTLFLELYDQGMVKQKLTKNTAENQRSEEVDGKTPTNMLLFGTPSKLLDGAITEEQFYSMLETGYARRCLFGWGQHDRKAFNTQSPVEIYNKLIQPSNTTATQQWANHFHSLADPAMFGWKMDVSDPVGIKLIEYKSACERAADELPEHEDVKKAEISHRYFKALKLAGAYAFVDQSNEVMMEHLMSAILLVEESGEAFKRILNREKPYVKLAKYLAEIGKTDTEVTHADLIEALPYYKSGVAARNEIMNLAMAWGYKQHIIIKKTFVDGIEFFRGDTLEETNIDEMILSYSDSWAYNYGAEGRVPFSELPNLTQAQDMHWANHLFKNGHRAEENVIPGFNMIVLDLDGGVRLETVHELLKEVKFMTYTTKRHTEEENRFRLIIPINYVLELDSDDYKEFMDNVLGWLPFKVDESANQRSRKWSTFHDGAYHLNLEGEILNALDFIPKTSKNEQYRQEYRKVQSMDNLERWFAQRMTSGSRNNNMLKFALALVDTGMDLMEINKAVHSFNKKLDNGLTEDEINNTVLVTVAKRFQAKS
jgi:Primase C terminal 1 (PriCT-1)